MSRFNIATFEKVSFEQFFQDVKKTVPSITDDDINIVKGIYADIKLPHRATDGSMGYDFYMPYEKYIHLGGNIVIPTGIRCKIEDGWGLFLFPRSGHGFKYGVHLANTVGLIDSDYYGADNEGHIMVKLANDANFAKGIKFEKGTAFCQGVFLMYGVAANDDTNEKRTGGFGSTDRQS